MRVAGLSRWGGAAAGAAAGPAAAAADAHKITSARSRCVVVPSGIPRGAVALQGAGVYARTRARASHRSWALGLAVVLGEAGNCAPAAVPGALDLALAVEVLEAFVDPGLGAADGVSEFGDLGAPRPRVSQGGPQCGQRVAVAGPLDHRRRVVPGLGPLRASGGGAPFGRGPMLGRGLVGGVPVAQD